MTIAILADKQTVVGPCLTVNTNPNANTDGRRGFQALVTGTGPVSATIEVSGCIIKDRPIRIATITLSGTDAATDATDDSFPWEYYTAEITVLTGVNASVTIVASV